MTTQTTTDDNGQDAIELLTRLCPELDFSQPPTDAPTAAENQ
jgi:hypothetical protein